MNAPIPVTVFRIEITEMDAQMQLRGGYEDADGNYVTTMSEEQFRAEFAALEGKIRLRAWVGCDGKYIAFESPTAPAHERATLLFDLTRRIANMMLTRLKAPSSSPAPSESALRSL